MNEKRRLRDMVNPIQYEQKPVDPSSNFPAMPPLFLTISEKWERAWSKRLL
jgi:hypothetical protein